MKKKSYLAAFALCLAFSTAAVSGAEENVETDGAEEIAAEVEETAAEIAEETTDTEEAEAGSEEAASEDAAAEEAADAAEELPEEVPAETGEFTLQRLVTPEKLSKYVKLGNYKGLALTKTISEVSEEDVDAEIDRNMSNFLVEVKDGAVEEGDTVIIDFVGMKDGEAFDGGTGDDYSLVIGSNTFIPGFEDGVIGMKPGETKDIDLTFPEDYFSEDLAGEEVTFQVTLENFRRPAELTDEWVAENAEGCETIEDYRAKVRADLEKEAEDYAVDMMMADAWNQVYDGAEVKEFPQEDIDAQIAMYDEITAQYAEYGGMTVEEFLKSQGMTEESYQEQIQQYAEEKVTQNLIAQYIVDEEKIDLTDDETKDIENWLVSYYGAQDISELAAIYGESQVSESIVMIRVGRYLVAEAEVTVEEEPAEEEYDFSDIEEEDLMLEEVEEDMEGAEEEAEVLFEEEEPAAEAAPAEEAPAEAPAEEAAAEAPAEETAEEAAAEEAKE